MKKDKVFAALVIYKSGAIATLGNYSSKSEAQTAAESYWQSTEDRLEAQVYFVLDLSDPELMGVAGRAAFVNTKKPSRKPSLFWGGEI